MFVVIFEVQPKPDRREDYLVLAKSLRPRFEAIDGFIDVERFASRRTGGRILSLSIWRDEKALVRWRTLAVHHAAQEKGRFELFRDYRLRVGEITGDTGLSEGQALGDQRRDETEVGAAKAATITELTAASADLAAGLDGETGLVDHELYDSIYTAGKLLLLASWRDAASAKAWMPTGNVRHRQIRIIRDYGMDDRREAPQYYPPVRRVGAE